MVLAVFPALAFSQTLADTAAAVKLLKTVVVCEHGRQGAGEAFDFYKTSKLSSTEDILQRMQGVNLTRRGAFGMEPMLRHYSAGQMNLTLDGMKIAGACTDKMDPASIYVEPVNLESIEMMQGAGGSFLGSTIGGSLNLQLKDADYIGKKKLYARVSQSYSSVNNGWNSSAVLNGNSGKLAARISGVFRKAGNYMAGAGSIVNFSYYEKINMATSLVYRASEQHSFKLNYVDDWGRDIGFPALPMDVGRARASVFSFSYKMTPAFSWMKGMESKVYLNTVEHFMDDTHRPDVVMHMDMPGWSKTIGAYNEANFFLGTHRLFYRADGYSSFTRADMTMFPANEKSMFMQTLPDNTLNNVGVSLREEWCPDSFYSIIVSGRLDFSNQRVHSEMGLLQWQVFNRNVSDELGTLLKSISLSYTRKIGLYFLATASASYGERLSTPNERYGYYLFNRYDGYDYIGDMSLEPEKARQVELSLQHESKYVTFNVTAFYHFTHDYIYASLLKGYSAMTPGANGVKGYSNIAFAETRGLESGITWKLGKRFSYYSNLKYLITTTSLGKPLPMIPPLKQIQSLRSSILKIQLQVDNEWALAQNQLNADFAEHSTPAYAIFGLRFARTWNVKSIPLQVAFACENILDNTYREHLDWGGIPRPGRNFQITLSGTFY